MRVGVLVVLAFAVALPHAASAYIGLCCSKCGGNMPMNIPGGGVPETHELRLKASPMYMRMEGLLDGDSGVGVDEVLAGGFMAAPTDMGMLMVNASAGYSFTDDLFGGLMLMYKRNDMDMRFNAMMQGMTGERGYTMRSDGFGDMMLMGKYRLCADDPLIPTGQASFFFGLSLPTGSIDERNDEQPLGFRRDELLPYGMQIGSGTVDPTFGLTYQGSGSPWWWGANVMYTGRWYDNARDWRWGDEVRVDLYAMYQLRYDLVLQLQLNTRWQDRIRGEMDEARTGESGRMMQGNPDSPYMSPLWDPDNYGGTELFTTFGFQWQPFPMHVIDLQAGLPLYQYLNGPQLERSFRVMLTWYIEIPTRRSIRHRGEGKKKSRLGF